VVFAPEAETDLLQLYDYIAELSGPDRALSYTDRITSHCLGLADFPERGRLRDDLRSGLRVTVFERRAVIAFHVTADRVTIDRIMYGGRDLEAMKD